ncbi:selenium-dependent molybdenum cofactor biosynthesis protein YqeB [Schnuerera ultunensis]|uniref:Selenium-dependent molybdenum hydroxylase system protein n=1 Tax=[Clostridium] ultunense Esp TaxID=1288971 RepID=A0A1M4PLL9_9FIRM|nr:selenium-dependent molybdenum cofactor biosynthesis protein YqeB [Schnuerera ultunensis]SHD76364.1 Selenium-dependent molybdenum hydroxylase system protein [[Clostridium] ultunense Esp]
MDTIIIRGGGDLATGIAYKLHKAGYRIIILEIDKPLTVRRAVAFSEAVYEGENTVEGIKGILAKNRKDIYKIWDIGAIPVYIDKEGRIIEEIKPLVVIDAIIAKRNLGTNKSMAPITIGIGPGFEAGKDVDFVVESNRGTNLGKIIHSGRASKNTGIPGEVMGYTQGRVLRAPCDGIVKAFCKIGDIIDKGNVICQVGDKNVIAPFKGILRGMIREGLYVNKGLKIGDIDPRCIKEYAFIISDKARIIGDRVLEGIQITSHLRCQAP